jgi:hypothetical protein
MRDQVVEDGDVERVLVSREIGRAEAEQLLKTLGNGSEGAPPAVRRRRLWPWRDGY